MQFFDIVLFALIAIFLVLRLRGVLGNRDGHEGGYNDRFKSEGDQSRSPLDDNGNVVELPNARAPQSASLGDEAPAPAAKVEEPIPEGPLGDGVRAIREYDPSFSPKEFVGGASMAFEMILNAYAEGDVKTLKNLLSPEVFGGFAQAIEQRNGAGQTLDETLVGIKAAEAVEAYMDGKDALVTVKFVSEQISALLDSDGTVIDGDPIKVIEATDFWTFARPAKSRDPNWTLVGTGSLE